MHRRLPHWLLASMLNHGFSFILHQKKSKVIFSLLFFIFLFPTTMHLFLHSCLWCLLHPLLLLWFDRVDEVEGELEKLVSSITLSVLTSYWRPPIDPSFPSNGQNIVHIIGKNSSFPSDGFKPTPLFSHISKVFCFIPMAFCWRIGRLEID